MHSILNEIPYQTAIALFFVRVIAGTLFLFQGYDKLFKVGVKGVYETFRQPMQKKNIPSGILFSSAVFTSGIEFIGGILLIIGLFTSWIILFLMIDILLVVIAFCMLEPMWDLKHVFPRLILLLILLFASTEANLFSIDYLLFKYI
jgi:putative oxidoreductase